MSDWFGSNSEEILAEKLRKKRPQAGEAGETACPTTTNTRLVMVAQAASPTLGAVIRGQYVTEPMKSATLIIGANPAVGAVLPPTAAIHIGCLETVQRIRR